jgi:protein-disulfide isomerase
VGDAEFPNIVTTGLTPLERETLKGLLTKFPSACGKPHSLLTSLRSDPGCKLSVVAGRWTAKLIGDGHLQSEIEEKYDRRFNKCYQIDVSGAQVYGDSSAPVTVVEFADFECPHCAITDPVLKQLVEQYKTKVKWVFMNYPIPMHPNAANAAAFALAAGRQGKFWEFKKKLFENQGQLDQLHIEQYAGEMKLDVGRLKADTEALRSRVRHERDIGERLDLSGTPSVYINCRKVEGSPTLDNLTSYVEAELAAR